MKKRTPPENVNVNAFEILQALTDQATEGLTKKKKPDQPEKNPAAVALGRLGGLKGGRARAEKLSAKKRAEIARKAAKSRWDKHNS